MFAHVCRAFLVLLLVSFASLGAAKSLARILEDTGLSPGDFDQLMAVEQALVQQGQVGRSRNWSNPDTGTKGVSKIASRQGSCVYMQHVVTLADDKPRKEFRTAFCQQSDGQWLRAPGR